MDDYSSIVAMASATGAVGVSRATASEVVLPMTAVKTRHVFTGRPLLDRRIDAYMDRFESAGRFPCVLLDEWDMDPPATLWERVMMQFINTVTDEPGWETKVFNSQDIDIFRRDRVLLAVRSDMSDLSGEVRPTASVTGFSDAMFDWCIWELQQKAQESAAAGGITRIYDAEVAVFKQDLAEGLRVDVADSLAPLEQEALTAEDSVKTWQPDQNETNLLVVAPSMYAFEYGRTPIVRDRVITLQECLDSIGDGEPVGDPNTLPDIELIPHFAMSRRFQLLPAEVELDSEGKAHITSYINNIHPAHSDAYRTMEGLLNATLPLLAAAYDSFQRKPWTRDEPNPRRFQADLSRCRANTICSAAWRRDLLSELGCKPSNYCTVGPKNASAQDAEKWFERTHPLIPPEPLGSSYDKQQFLSAQRAVPSSPVSVLGNRLQIIVSVSSVLLTPDKPQFPGSQFNVEGLVNERVSAVGVYCYESDNVTESRMSFEAPAVYDPKMDAGNTTFLHGIGEPKWYEPASWISLGSVPVRCGRVVAFPNVFGHREEPFELVDKTRPGSRKTVTICIVDPLTPVLSTANVPPQQSAWTEHGSDVDSEWVDVGPEMSHRTSEELLEERRTARGRVLAERLEQARWMREHRDESRAQLQ
ncbi:uncharacterized protein LOC62_03G003802 [Vanrija pseudolonga]|uniref:Uncharacterized protein n=1 Tax=Vanrija pseudolonga TaxID=143232 RepID=A0AAF0YAY6_9TREE|nr:hypothetical protein LOC62_03G003802 [Vanrija pseudolonga]